MGINAARAACPELVLVNGEDLTPYRAASSQLVDIVKRFGPAEKVGLDEVFVDVTEVLYGVELAAREYG